MSHEEINVYIACTFCYEVDLLMLYPLICCFFFRQISSFNRHNQLQCKCLCNARTSWVPRHSYCSTAFHHCWNSHLSAGQQSSQRSSISLCGPVQSDRHRKHDGADVKLGRLFDIRSRRHHQHCAQSALREHWHCRYRPNN